MENLEKTITKQWFGCPTCDTKMETMTISSSGLDLFSFGQDKKVLYCNNKECEKFGYLTVAGVKKQE